jgi:hypothetical protein
VIAEESVAGGAHGAHLTLVQIVDVDVDQVLDPHGRRFENGEDVVPGLLGLGGETLFHDAGGGHPDLTRDVQHTSAWRHFHALAVVGGGRRHGRRVVELEHRFLRWLVCSLSVPNR